MTAIDENLLRYLNEAPVAFFIKDAEEGRYLYANPAAIRFFKPTDEKAIGRTAHDMFSEDVAADSVAGDRRVIATGAVVLVPLWIPVAEGRRHVAVVKFPIRFGEQACIGGVALDITTFAASSWDDSTYRQILDAMKDLIIVKGPRSKVRWANKAFLEAYGMKNDELQGLVDAPFVEPDTTQKYVRDDQLVFATRRPLDIPEENLTCADGRVLTVHTVKSPIFDAAGQVAMSVAVIRDITERKRLEVELAQAQKLESIGRLAAGMAHEINTPIQYIGGQAHFGKSAVADLVGLVSRYRALVAKVESGTATASDAAEIRAAETEADLDFGLDNLPPAFDAIIEGADRIARLVRAMTEFGRPDRGERIASDINASLRNVLIVAVNEYKNVADVELDLGELPPVICNLSELGQVFLNLIVNAGHAIAALPSPAERGRIGVTTRVDGDDVVVSIADTGTGIPEAIRSHVFDPFFTTKEVGRGSGQGLSIARMFVVDKHQGSIHFETEMGRGTTFHVRIPRSPAVATGKPMPSTTS